jgi:hypothetical protein
VEAAEVMAIGDNFNDLAMLEYAGQPVLMGNASEELQTIGRRHGWGLTLSNDEDGVAATLEPLVRNAQEAEAGNSRIPEVVTAEPGARSR